MYAYVLVAHSWLRWLVLALGVALLLVSFTGWRRGRAWTARDARLQEAFMGVLDTQMSIGLVLYIWLSPLAEAARADLGAAMKVAQLRYFGVEHIATMLIAVVVAHAGKVRATRKQGSARLRSTFVTQLVWLLLTLVAIPWPGLDVARPLLRY